MAFPRADADMAIWLNNFSNAFAAHATALGFNAADTTAVQNDAAMLNYLVGTMLPTYKNALQARTAYKNLLLSGPVGAPGGAFPAPPADIDPPASVPPGIIPRLRSLIARIQAAPNYTEAVGRDLGITASADSTGGANAPGQITKPNARAFALAGSEVRIEFNKAGFDGVAIESRRTGETAWSNLGTDNFSPYLDARPPVTAGHPEVREYRLRFLHRDEPTGDWSDIISATTNP